MEEAVAAWRRNVGMLDAYSLLGHRCMTICSWIPIAARWMRKNASWVVVEVDKGTGQDEAAVRGGDRIQCIGTLPSWMAVLLHRKPVTHWRSPEER